MKSEKKKAFVLGIDGATFDIIYPLMEKGKLPNMQKLIAEGMHGTLHSTVPAISAPAWVTFMTGKNPGHYGTYHFYKINSESYHTMYSLDLINSSVYHGDTFFDYLGRIGYKVGIMTVPVTYPPWEVNGFLVSGYPCPDPDENSNFAFPRHLGKELPENLNWTEKESSDAIPKEEMRGAKDPPDILKGGLAMMSRRTAYTLKLMKQFNTDVTILVWGAIDRAQHLLWKYHDPRHILHQPDNKYEKFIEELYCHADTLLGEIISCIGSDTSLFILSDHGFGPKQGSYFHLNAWLKQQQYLKTNIKSGLTNNPIYNMLKGRLRNFVSNMKIENRRKIINAKKKFGMSAIDIKKTRAYRLPIDEQTEGLVINLKGRQPAGIVTENEYEVVRSELIDKLSMLQHPHTGKQVIKKCFRREELFSGDKAHYAPDIILVLQEDYCPGSGNSGKNF